MISIMISLENLFHQKDVIVMLFNIFLKFHKFKNFI